MYVVCFIVFKYVILVDDNMIVKSIKNII
jgi:hypothetical protein